jgi:hypothetical protein
VELEPPAGRGNLVRKKVRAVGLAVLLALGAGPGRAEVEPALGVEIGSPLKLSANLGIRIGTVQKDGSEYGRGFLVQAQPGLGGVAFNVGWAPVALPAWGTQAVGLAIKARVLRTWGDPWAGLEPEQNYVGGEVGVAWIVKISVGVLTRVSGDGGKKTIVTWGVGIGL